jgi:SNF2 family DNA or RNA helicase
MNKIRSYRSKSQDEEATKMIEMIDENMQIVTKNDVAQRKSTPEKLAEEESRFADGGWTLAHYSINNIPAAYKKHIKLAPVGPLAKIHECIRLAKKAEFNMAESKKDQNSLMVETIAYLRELTSNPMDVKPEIYHRYCDPEDVELLKSMQPQKLAAIVDYYNDDMEKGDKGIVFCHFIPSAKRICEALNEMGIGAVLITGKLTDVKKLEVCKRFSEDPNIHFLVATHCISHGINLPQANHVIFYTLWWTFAEDSQAYARTLRVGQTKPVKIVHLIITNTIDENILAVASNKQSETAKLGSKEQKKMLGF